MLKMVILFICLNLFTNVWASEAPTQHPSADDYVLVDGLPAIGQWMLDDQNQIAHWLGYHYKGHSILEPINIIIAVSADSSDEAQGKLIDAVTRSGFINRKGHSSGYKAFINHLISQQVAPVKDYAFSDRPYLFNNNHGRFFGPEKFNGKYYFTGGFSRENADYVGKEISKLKHKYQSFHTYRSFKIARDKFVKAMLNSGGATRADAIQLNNAVNDGTYTTGDHDGFAVLLSL